MLCLLNYFQKCLGLDSIHRLFYLKFPRAVTPVMKRILFFHEDCLLVVFFVLTIVLTLILYIVLNYYSSTKNFEKSILEISWTLIPRLIIIILILPSLEVLYFSDSKKNVFYYKNIKVVGHQ
jgi:cytochrome c oxidase subunit II